MADPPQSPADPPADRKAKPEPGLERYPSTDRTDSIKGVEPRSFDTEPDADLGPREDNDQFLLGPGGDPAEGKRDG